MKTMQASYAAGVLAPSLHSRTDLTKWQIGLAQANNMLVHVHGGISNRPGTYYVGQCDGPNRKIPFEYSVDDTYVLELSDYKMRVIRDGGYIVHPATMDVAAAFTLDGNSDVINPWSSSIASRMTYVVTSTTEIYQYQTGTGATLYNGFGLTIHDDGTVGITYWDNSAGALAEETAAFSAITLVDSTDYSIVVEWDGDDVSITVDGGTKYTYTLTDVNDTTMYEQADWDLHIWSEGGEINVARYTYEWDSGAQKRFDFTPLLDGSLYDSIYGTTVYNRDQEANYFPLEIIIGTEADPDAGSVLEVDSPFAYADLAEIRFAQREDVMYFTHTTYPEQKLVRHSHYQWWFSPEKNYPNIGEPSNLAGTYNGTPTAGYNVDYVVAAVNAAGEEGFPSDLVSVNADPSSSWDSGKYVTLTWDAVSGADLYVVYKNSRGYYGYIGSTTDLTFKDDNIAPDSADGPKVYRNPFDGAGNYPGAVGIYQQRKVYGRTDNSPQTAWMTQSGTMDNLSVSRPLKDDDAVTAQLDSNQVNEILHFVPMKDLVVVTNNGVWTLSSGANADAITPTNPRYDLQEARGGSSVRPIVSGNTILMVPDYRKGVKEMFYQVQAQGFQGSDLEILSNHFFSTDRIKDWAYQRDQSVVWCVMESGILLSLTYLREHEVVAWTSHDTQGTFEAVCVVRSADRDVPYFTVKRTVGGSDVYYSEYLTERLPNDTLEDGVFLDSALTYDGPGTSTLSGLDHLEGRTVSVLADGSVIENKIVSSGSITLSRAYNKVHVGLAYTADMETLDIDYQAQDGAGFGNLKVVTGATLSLENSRGLQVGPTADKLDEMKFRTDEDYDAPTRMFTGKKKVGITPQWNFSGRIHIRQPYPLPVTVLAHIPEFQSGE